MERSLHEAEACYEPGHPSVASSQGNLALVLTDLGEPAEARDLLRKALAADEASYEPGHPSIATDQSILGVVLKELGELAEARDLLRKAYRSLHDKLGPNNPKTKIVLGNLRSVEGEAAD